MKEQQLMLRVSIVCPGLKFINLFKDLKTDKLKTDKPITMPAKTTETFIQDVKRIYGDLYNCDKVVYTNSRDPVIIICTKHGEFTEKPVNITKTGGYGCKECGKDRFLESVKKRTGNVNSFVSKAKTVHGDKYNYDKVVYKNAKTKVIITCSSHGDFEQIPDDHLHNKGCCKCAKISMGDIYRKSKDDFIKTSQSVHGDKFTYDKVNYIGNKHHVIITCKLHGDFEQTPANHLYFNGCSKCINYKNENECIHIIEELTGLKFTKTKPKFLNGLELDGYNKDTKVAIEYNGRQHYEIVDHFHRDGIKDLLKQVENDKLKEELCKENNIHLIVVPYYIKDKRTYIQEQLDLID